MMADTTLSPARSVDNDHHDHHHRHIGDVCDGGDDGALLLTSPAEEIPDDPITIIEADDGGQTRWLPFRFLNRPEIPVVTLDTPQL